jgi:hypothetical protein
MAEIPRVSQQNIIQTLTDRKSAVSAARKRLETSITMVRRARAMFKQAQFFEREIDAARGRMFMLMVAQLRHAEISHSEKYLVAIDEALQELTAADKGAEKK